MLRTVTLTPAAVAASGKPTPTTSAPPVARVRRLSTVEVPLGAAAPFAAAAAEAPATGEPAGMGTRWTEGRTAWGAAPTETTGTTMVLVASRVDAATMRTVLMGST
jgi:hypothetical protein